MKLLLEETLADCSRIYYNPIYGIPNTEVEFSKGVTYDTLNELKRDIEVFITPLKDYLPFIFHFIMKESNLFRRCLLERLPKSSETSECELSTEVSSL